MVRERAGSATELGEILDLAADAKGGGQEGGVMEVDGGDEGMREEKPSQREQQRQQRGGSPGAGNVAEEGWPSVQRLVRCVGLVVGRAIRWDGGGSGS